MEPITFELYTIYRGDCLEILKHFPPECVDLIYIDPPFNSNRNYEVFWGDTAEKRAFDDRYGDAIAYIAYMRPRIGELYRVLKKTGSFFYHCDWHASHYIKVMLDEIFGANCFQNEIVWKRTSAHNDPKRFGNVSDSIFFYSKGKEYHWHVQYSEYSKEYENSHYHNVEANTGRRFRYDNLNNTRPGGYMYELLGCPPPKNGWRMPETKAKEWILQGRIEIPPKGKVPAYKRYLDEMPGVPLQDIWTDIPPVNPMSKERLGFPTQKPVPLIERIINASSNEGDIVLDAFCGCGTTLVACGNLNRKWLGIDISPTACRVMGKRISEHGRLELPITGQKKRGKRYFRFSNLPMSIVQLKGLSPFEFENWAVLAVGQFFNMYAQTNRSKVGDLGIDGRLYLPVNVAKHKSKDNEKTPLFEAVEGEKYVPIQVKQKDKASRIDIDNFAHAMERDGRTTGVFVAFGYSRDALSEIHRLSRLSTNRLRIYPLTVEKLLASDFSVELDALISVEG
jgi:site-specific DNA-methyltransferase (adenine-specific)